MTAYHIPGFRKGGAEVVAVADPSAAAAAFKAMRSIPPADHGKFVGKPFFDGTLAAAKMVPVDFVRVYDMEP